MPTVRTSEEAKALARRRWDKPRPAPIDKRVRTLPSGSKLEERWLAKAVDLGLVYEGMTRNAHRRLAKRLADDDTARKIKRVHDARPAGIADDDDLLLAHLEAEAARWRARVKRDRQIALAHELLAEKAEQELADLMWKLGLIS
ncbi:hypothetical protein RN51_00436 [Microbacterium oxydans]|uniref:Uncharacterized protein n=1 Tax=Microbacterium oxydans TaxID=82380 RepID=A0A0F0KZR7_9MICO|nr:hypothetical protein [Microbacterium oxydans]KJL25929.1 hypothetical protein RN51_00436 [Microbacterium oxydans]